MRRSMRAMRSCALLTDHGVFSRQQAGAVEAYRGGRVKGAGSNVGKEGLCIWWLAGKLSMANRKNVMYECRASVGTHSHKPLSQVTQKTVLKLLDDPTFTSACSQDSLKMAIKATNKGAAAWPCGTSCTLLTREEVRCRRMRRRAMGAQGRKTQRT